MPHIFCKNLVKNIFGFAGFYPKMIIGLLNWFVVYYRFPVVGISSLQLQFEGFESDSDFTRSIPGNPQHLKNNCNKLFVYPQLLTRLFWMLCLLKQINFVNKLQAILPKICFLLFPE